jgi:uncharacterized sodium:solute symporter family permease YidK
VGLAAGGAKDGLVIGNFEWMACFTLALLALVFAPFYIRSGVRTLPEFMERRYCPEAHVSRVHRAGGRAADSHRHQPVRGRQDL